MKLKLTTEHPVFEPKFALVGQESGTVYALTMTKEHAERIRDSSTMKLSVVAVTAKVSK